MFVHAVYFWLKPDLTTEERAAFERGVQSLTSVDAVHQGYLGVPAATNRPVIDRSYSRALVLVFPDKAAHDRYQIDPIHVRFVETCGTFWTRVQIYDSVG